MFDRREKEKEIEQKTQFHKMFAPRELAEEPIQDESRLEPSSRSSTPSPILGSAQRSGRWTPDEKILFLYGLKRFGKGRWKKMSIYLPHRSLVQIKSHAQKVLKRLEAGENVFRRLEENYNVIDALIVEAAKQRDDLAKSNGLKSVSSTLKRKRATKRSPSTQQPATQSLPEFSHQTSLLSNFGTDTSRNDADAGKGAVIAAAALCQLSSVGWDKDNQKSFSLYKS